jgi:chromosome segregation ATPase
MSYTHYCLGLAAQTVDPATMREKEATAYAIGSLDRLAAVRLPRCRKEVEDAVAALSDPNYVTMSQWQERCDRLQAERDEYHSQLDTLRSQLDTLPTEDLLD